MRWARRAGRPATCAEDIKERNTAQQRSSGGVPFAYTAPANTALNQVTYYDHDHLGNTRLTYTPTRCQDLAPTDGVPEWALNIEHAVDYDPYGSILREFVNGQQEKYLTTHHERDVETGLDYRGARYYDSDVARFLSLDPLAADYASWSPYNYVMGNPVSLVDPTGKSAECGCPNPPCPEQGGPEAREGSGPIQTSLDSRGTNAPDQLGGIIHTPTNEDWILNPWSSFRDLVISTVYSLSGLSTLESLSTSVVHGTISTDQVVNAAVNIGLSGRNGPGKGGARPRSGGGARGPDKLQPYSDPVTGAPADGAHTTYKRNDAHKVVGFETYHPNPKGGYSPVLRFRGEGKPHGGVSPPMFYTPKGSVEIGDRLGAPLRRANPPTPEDILPDGY